ncbi:hypothetical protein EVAR_81014_1 [Eumeta japonica]|uniref:Uncharacterized protein n=1 Tax=Eumeta variegata TaxID=151549 RepID=A0A4C1T6A0_EUMVA|nr:hypothetical protein EVAR_81014_1 [Eumeta japonica]
MNILNKARREKAILTDALRLWLVTVELKGMLWEELRKNALRRADRVRARRVGGRTAEIKTVNRIVGVAMLAVAMGRHAIQWYIYSQNAYRSKQHDRTE